MSTIPKIIGRVSAGIVILLFLLFVLTRNYTERAIAQVGPTATLQPAVYFLYPLPQPTWGSYSNNRYGVQNPFLSGGTCFVNTQGTRVPWNELYHAGSDWFHKPDVNAGTGKDVSAIGIGEVVYRRRNFYPGDVIIVKHRLPDNSFRYSQYGHIDSTVSVDDRPKAGDKVGTVYNQANNTHLHWEVRSFGATTSLYPTGSAGQRGVAYPPDYRNCNQDYGVGYTWDDDPAKRHPDYWGYTDPEAFVAARLPKNYLPLILRDFPPATPTRTPTPTPTRTRTPTPTPCGYVNCPQGYPGP